MHKGKYNYRDFLSKERIAELQKMIVDNWYLTLEELGRRINLDVRTLYKLMLGYSIGPISEQKIVAFFETYKGENCNGK